MNGLKIVATVTCVIAVVGSQITARATSAAATAKWKNIDANFTSQVTTEACTSPVGICAAGTITHDGFLKGSTFISLNDLAPSAGMPASEPASMLSISGDRSLTPDHQDGALSAHATGIFDTVQGYFDELEVIVGGTGSLAGATGALHLFGRATGPSTFAGEVRGSICLP